MSHFRLLIAVLLGCLLLTDTGCVRRRLTIRSNPSGAMVSIDNREIGETPVSTSYTYYGTRNFVVTRDGYETAEVQRTFHPPWYQLPVLDLITENFWPWELRDERAVDFQLIPKQTVDTDALLGRAENLRTSAQQGTVTPLPPTHHHR